MNNSISTGTLSEALDEWVSVERLMRSGPQRIRFITKPLHPDDCWRLQAAPGAACDSWRLLATPGVVCILVVPVVLNKKIRYILFQVSHSKTYKIYCKELVQATCKITSKIKM